MPTSRVTLVTGFPSFRASHLVRHLLAADGGAVWCVVPAQQHADAERFGAALTAEQRARLRLFSGEPWAIDFGLSGAEYRELAAHVSCIQHLAQATSEERDLCETVNIGGMREVLELGRMAPRLERIVVHSSVAVSGDRVGRVLEAELEARQRFPGPLSATLARAERMARISMERLPIVVLRTGQVVGSAHDGPVDTLEGVYLLILLSLNAPQDLSPQLPSWGDAPLHVTPIDHVVRVADVVSRLADAPGQTLHVTDPTPMSVRMAFNRCVSIRQRSSAEGFTMPPLRRVLRQDGLVREGLQALLSRPRSFINATFRHVSYATDVAERLLSSSGLRCPPLESYFEEMVRHVARAIAEAPSSTAAAAPEVRW